jgi:serine/threonine protein kinase
MAPERDLGAKYEDHILLCEDQFKKLYCLQGVIGSGTYATVYSAVRLDDNTLVAVKHIEKTSVVSWHETESTRLPQEISMLYQLRDVVGVIKIIDWCELKDSFVIILEYSPHDRDLYYFSLNDDYTEPVVRNIFRQVLTSVLACYKKNIIHRDIKLENVLINTVTHQTKLIDFGGAAFLNQGGYSDFNGTNEYRPPEWICKSVYFGGPSTTWSLGVLLFSIISNDVPFETDSDIVLAQPDFSRVRVPVSHLCKNLIERCLCKNYKERILLDDICNHPWLCNQ